MKPMKRESVILVPFAVDETMQTFIPFAGALALRTGASLRLFHVIKPLAFGLGAALESSGITSIVENEQIRLAEAGLRRAVELLPPGVAHSEAYSIASSVPGAILGEAADHEVDLILCGTTAVSHRYLPKGFSTVLSLMANAPVPVMVVPPKAVLAGRDEFFHIMILDDLRESSISAIRCGLEWAGRLNRTRIHHVHVNAITKEEFIVSLFATTSPEGLPLLTPIDPEELYRQFTASLQRKMAGRLVELGFKADEFADRYEATLLTGSLTDEINRLAAKEGVDAIVFGKHRLIHSQPLGIGHTPYQLMLEQTHPILVMPALS